MSELDRRTLFSAIGCGAAFAVLPSSDYSILATRLATAQNAMLQWRAAFYMWRTSNTSYDVIEVATHEGIFERFIPTAPTLIYESVRDHAQAAVEDALMTTPESEIDDAAIMEALDLYAEIAPSAFALMTARDLFTPERYQTYPLAQIRHWLLTGPDEEFEKSGMPGFLKTLRQGVSPV